MVQEVGHFPRRDCPQSGIPTAASPCGTAGVQSHRSRKPFLEQAGQTSERQALGSAHLAPRPEGSTLEDPSPLPSVPRSLPTVITLGSRSSGEHPTAGGVPSVPGAGCWCP